jgi:hypothetical protein
MPFSPTALVPLIQTGSFNLWHYRSADLRADIAAPGYFAPALGQLRAGDVLILQAADAMAVLPLRSNALTGPGVTLDGAVAPVAITRSIAQRFGITQAAAAVVRTIVLAPLLAGIVAGTTIPVQAQVAGPVSQVVVSLLDGAGRLVPPAQTLTVSQGYVTAALPTPPSARAIASASRIPLDPSLSATSRAFSILPDLRLVLSEEGLRLLQENGFAIAQN